MGPVLFQLPPNLKKDLPRLSDFLTVLPPALRCAFRVPPRVVVRGGRLRALRGRGCALCVAEDEELATPFVATAGWGVPTPATPGLRRGRPARPRAKVLSATVERGVRILQARGEAERARAGAALTNILGFRA